MRSANPNALIDTDDSTVQGHAVVVMVAAITVVEATTLDGVEANVPCWGADSTGKRRTATSALGVVLMTKHRTITGFVAVALLAVAATAATMRRHSPWTDGIVVSAGTTLLKGLTVDANKAPDCEF
jgi:hypothetical protein